MFIFPDIRNLSKNQDDSALPISLSLPFPPKGKISKRTSAALHIHHSHSQPTGMNFSRGMTSQETDLVI